MNDWNSAAEEAKLNEAESKFGPQMSESELAALMNVPVPAPKPVDKIPETAEEMEEWERKQENSNDIYKISARVKNLARGSGGSLTSVGDMLANSYTHVLKSLYDFAETIPEPYKEKLIELIRFHEKMPADVIASAGVGVKQK